MALTTMLGLIAAGSVVSAGASIGGTAMNIAQKNEDRDKNFEQNRALMQEQAKINQENWEKQFNMTNEYNSPSQQIARLQSAGINPLFSDMAGSSSASPSSGTASLPSVSMPHQVDYVDALQSMVSTVMRLFELKNQTALTSSQVEKNAADTDSVKKDIVNKTNLTNSELAVNAAKINQMIKEGNLTDEQRQYIEQQTAASKEAVKQKWHELQLMSENIGVQLRKVANEEYTTRWQEAVGKMNAYSNELQGQASKEQADIARNVYNFGVNKWQSEFKMKVAEFSKQCTNENIDNFIKLAKESGFSIGSTNFTKQKWIAEQSAIAEAFVKNLGNLDSASFNKALPVFLDIQSTLEGTTFKYVQKPEKKSYNPAPWFPDEM